jgi:hypothetical protein
VGGVAPAHLPLHYLLGAPHRRWIRRRRRHFDVRGVQEAAGGGYEFGCATATGTMTEEKGPCVQHTILSSLP